jgi:4'-phosphopantetheinyl transferase
LHVNGTCCKVGIQDWFGGDREADLYNGNMFVDSKNVGAIWLNPPSELTLEINDVHVWRAWLDISGTRLALLEATLSEDELRRVARFHFEKNRKRYIVSQGTLRTLLGRYLGCQPSKVRIGHGLYGKPELAEVNDKFPLRFNLAHSHQVGLLAFTLNREIGVDTEKARPLRYSKQIAERFFSPKEYAVWQALKLKERQDAFYRCWTRKEAFIKAIGKGLSYPLQQFDVSMREDEPARILAIRDNEERGRRWLVEELAPALGYAAAVVAYGTDWSISRWDVNTSETQSGNL